jgi:hypothetical protein
VAVLFQAVFRDGSQIDFEPVAKKHLLLELFSSIFIQVFTG